MTTTKTSEKTSKESQITSEQLLAYQQLFDKKTEEIPSSILFDPKAKPPKAKVMNKEFDGTNSGCAIFIEDNDLLMAGWRRDDKGDFVLPEGWSRVSHTYQGSKTPVNGIATDKKIRVHLVAISPVLLQYTKKAIDIGEVPYTFVKYTCPDGTSYDLALKDSNGVSLGDIGWNAEKILNSEDKYCYSVQFFHLIFVDDNDEILHVHRNNTITPFILSLKSTNNMMFNSGMDDKTFNKTQSSIVSAIQEAVQRHPILGRRYTSKPSLLSLHNYIVSLDIDKAKAGKTESSSILIFKADTVSVDIPKPFILDFTKEEQFEQFITKYREDDISGYIKFKTMDSFYASLPESKNTRLNQLLQPSQTNDDVINVNVLPPSA